MWSLMALVWFALALARFGDGDFAHATVTFAVGTGCWLTSELLRVEKK